MAFETGLSALVSKLSTGNCGWDLLRQDLVHIANYLVVTNLLAITTTVISAAVRSLSSSFIELITRLAKLTTKIMVAITIASQEFIMAVIRVIIEFNQVIVQDLGLG